MARETIRFLRSGRLVELEDVDPNETLLDYLRLREGACGSKEGCAEGDCGACTVALGELSNGKLVYRPVNSCIQLLGMADGKEVVTVDDLASDDGELHPVQQAMVDKHGSQCGFCTPGFVMSLFTLYHQPKAATHDVVNDTVAGNLCRCTGYRPIVDAAIASCTGKPDDDFIRRMNGTIRALQDMQNDHDVFIGNEQRFFAAPASTNMLAVLLGRHPDAVIVAGATDVGLWITKQLRDLPKVIWVGRIQGFDAITEDKNSVTIAAGATYAQAEAALGGIDPDIAEVLRRLGSKHVRSAGTVGGNIANGSPIGDTPPMLIALGATLELDRGVSRRTLPLEKFFIEYGKQDLQPGEFVSRVIIPKLVAGQVFRSYKISKRFDQDISALLGAFLFAIRDGRVTAARIAYGGMAGTPKRAREAETAVTGIELSDREAVERACAALASDFTPMTDMRASAEYRLETARALLRKALIEAAGAPSTQTRVCGIREKNLERVA